VGVGVDLFSSAMMLLKNQSFVFGPSSLVQS
jgi:hypothetical protein